MALRLSIPSLWSLNRPHVFLLYNVPGKHLLSDVPSASNSPNVMTPFYPREHVLSFPVKKIFLILPTLNTLS